MLPKIKAAYPKLLQSRICGLFAYRAAVKRKERTMKEISIREFEGLAIGQAENKARG